MSTPSGPSWKRLLYSDEGPLVALLGYRDLAPLDSGGGDVVAERMAQAMARELKDDFGTRYTLKWLEINQKYGESTWTAAAIDLQGYWYINKKQILDPHTRQIRPVRDGAFRERDQAGKKIKEGDIIGPIPMP